MRDLASHVRIFCTAIENGRSFYAGIPSVGSVEWAQLVVLTEDEVWTQLQVKAQMGGSDVEHLGSVPSLPVHIIAV
jgi:hypothetical protein